MSGTWRSEFSSSTTIPSRATRSRSLLAQGGFDVVGEAR